MASSISAAQNPSQHQDQMQSYRSQFKSEVDPDEIDSDLQSQGSMESEQEDENEGLEHQDGKPMDLLDLIMENNLLSSSDGTSSHANSANPELGLGGQTIPFYQASHPIQISHI